MTERSNSVFAVLALVLSVANAQQPVAPANQHGRRCATTEHLNASLRQDPGLAQRMAAIEAHTQQSIGASGGGGGTVYTIPVVVHVVYNNAAENVSDAQIQSAIQALTEDFRRTNPDAGNTPAIFLPVAADCEIEFCLADTDPMGNPTNGITRTMTSMSSFSGNNNAMMFTSMGGHDIWPRDDYMNIWVCDLSGGLLGYAYYPGANPNNDGMVIDYQAFGTIGSAISPYNLGRTGSHEVGHWLNLRHIWGNGCGTDDLVADTPDSDNPNYGCPSNHVSCGSVDMVQNYMDYTDDPCMNLFTEGQKSRMRALFNNGGPRNSLLNSNGCTPIVVPMTNDELYVSFDATTNLPDGVVAQPEDIVRYDFVTTTWSMFMDGSDIGLSGLNVSSCQVFRTGGVLFTIDTDAVIPGLLFANLGTVVSTSDILYFSPLTTGSNTTGFVFWAWDGSDVGLDGGAEGIDALFFSSDGTLFMSLAGDGFHPQIGAFSDEDMVAAVTSAYFTNTAATLFFGMDGSDVGLSSSSENIDALHLDLFSGIQFSTSGNFNAQGTSGANEDIARFFGLIGPNTSGTISIETELSTLGVPGSANVDGYTFQQGL